jgi:hypothetical protein
MRLFRHKFRLAICVVLGLPLIYLAEEHLRGRWRLAQWKSAKTAEGERFLIKECLPPPSAEENGFAALSRVAAMQPGQSVSTLAPPTAKYAAPGRMVPIRTLADWPRGPGGPRELRETNVTWVELDRELEQWTDSLEEARSVLKQSAFDSKLDYYAGFSLALPHLARFKGLAQSFAIAAADSLHHHRGEEALLNIEAILDLSRAMQNEHLLISQLVRQAIAATAFTMSWQALQESDWTDGQLARLQHQWQLQEFIGPLGHSLEMERAMALDMYSQMRRSVADSARLLGVWSGGTSTSKPVNSLADLGDYLVENSGELFFKGVYLPVWQIAWSRQDELNYLELTQSFIASARACAEQRSGRPAKKGESEYRDGSANNSTLSRARFLVSSMITPSLQNAVTKSVSAEIQRELAVAAIALTRYELKRRRRPQDLSGLVPEFMAEAPRDFWADSPLVYRPVRNDGFLLYSVGPDGRDDGGDPTPSTRSGSNFPLSAGRDLVWPEPATKAEVVSALAPRSGSRPRIPGVRPEEIQKTNPPPAGN